MRTSSCQCSLFSMLQWALISARAWSAGHGAIEGEQLDRLDGGLGFAPPSSHRLTEAEESLAVEDADHQRRHMSSAFLIGPPEALAVNRHPLRQRISAGLLAKSGHETH